MEEEQLPGQMNVNDYRELLPEGMKTGAGEANGDEGERRELSGSGEGQGRQPVGSDTRGQGTDNSAEHNESDGAAEDGGRAADNGAVRQQDPEEEAWVEARNTVINLRRQFNAYFGHEKDLTTGTVECLYKKAINAAAALEKVLIARGWTYE